MGSTESNRTYAISQLVGQWTHIQENWLRVESWKSWCKRLLNLKMRDIMVRTCIIYFMLYRCLVQKSSFLCHFSVRPSRTDGSSWRMSSCGGFQVQRQRWLLWTGINKYYQILWTAVIAPGNKYSTHIPDNRQKVAYHWNVINFNGKNERFKRFCAVICISKLSFCCIKKQRDRKRQAILFLLRAQNPGTPALLTFSFGLAK